jgi:exo-beta-1,3-glucanase (GH17 family)
MHLPIGLFVMAAIAIVGGWAWLGAAVPMPPSPLGPAEKLYCVSYAPFRGAQSPLDPATRVSVEQIDDDLARLSRSTDCVRTYSTGNGLDQIPAIAARHGLKVTLGLWLSSHPDKNAREIETAVALANRHRDTVRTVVVGNEVLLRGEMAASDLAATIRRVKAQVPAPVTYADVWEFWLRYRDVYEAVDFVTIHILPYWEDFPVSAGEAAAHVDSIRNRLVASFPNKEVVIGETGWPSAGRMRAGALPSPSDQARVIHEVMAASKRGSYSVNLIEAFDQPWKRRLEGTVGGHWGLFDAEKRQAKFGWGQALSNHPGWRLQATAGVALAAAVFAAGWLGQRREARPTARRWLAVAGVATVAGFLLGWTLEKAALESLGIGGWLRSVALVSLAIAAPVVAAAAFTQGAALPRFAQVLGGAGGQRPDQLPFALGLVFVVLCAMALQLALGLVFDPRYRDFPFTALTGAALPYLLLAFANPRDPGPRGTAERITAAVLALSAVYVVLNEGFANWQAVWFCATLAALVIILLPSAVARSSG